LSLPQLLLLTRAVEDCIAKDGVCTVLLFWVNQVTGVTTSEHY